jgi:hypothetical protein
MDTSWACIGFHMEGAVKFNFGSACFMRTHSLQNG